MGDRSNLGWSALSRRLAVGTVLGLVMMSCSSDDSAEPAATTTTTELALGSDTTSTTPDDTDDTDDVEPDSTDPDDTDDTDDVDDVGPDSTDPDDTDSDPAACLVGAWLLDGPQFVANSVTETGEDVLYSSGSYIYTFSDDGTFDVAVDDFNIIILESEDEIIESEDEQIRVASNGSEQGTWIVFADPMEAADMFDIVDPPDLPHVSVITTNVSVSQTGFFLGETIPLGEVDQDQGLDGVGAIDCDAGTMVIRGTVPLAIDYPFTRM